MGRRGEVVGSSCDYSLGREDVRVEDGGESTLGWA